MNDSMPSATSPRRYRCGWLEIALVISMITLVFQLFPDWFFGVLRALDVRSWSRATWFLVNLVAVLTLIVYQYGGGVWRSIRRVGADSPSSRDRHPPKPPPDRAAMDAYYRSQIAARDWEKSRRKRLP